MATQIKMPQLGESVVEGTITKWLKQEGDDVAEDDLLVEVSTDKVDSEVPSSAGGKLLKILVPEGETVKVGEAIAEIGEAGEAASTDGGEPEQSQKESAPAAEGGADTAPGGAVRPQEGAEQQQPVAEEQAAARQRSGQAGEAPSTEESQETSEMRAAPEEQPAESEAPTGRQAQPERSAPAGAEEQDRAAAAADGGPARGRAPGDRSKRGIISPLVRRLADEHGVELDELEGTGTGGRIRKQDVLRHVEERKARPAAKPAAQAEPAPEAEPREAPRPAAAGEREELVPWSNIRRRTAEHMAASAREVARAWNAVEADWTEVVALRERAKQRFREREGVNLTYTSFLAKVVCDTLREMPEVNATFDEANQANLVKHYVNLGIAVALEGGGLIVPVVKAADEKNLVGLARAIDDIVTRARSKKLSPDDLAGGTFTITNPGPFGSVISVPIIPRGQTAILGFEAIRKGVVVTQDDAIAIRSTGFLSLSWDHRIIDGAEAAQFLARLRERVETTDFSSELSRYL